MCVTISIRGEAGPMSFWGRVRGIVVRSTESVRLSPLVLTEPRQPVF